MATRRSVWGSDGDAPREASSVHHGVPPTALSCPVTTEEVVRSYPPLTPEDVLACVAYGAELARERVIETPSGMAG